MHTTRTLYSNDKFLEKLPLYPTSGLLLLEALSGLARYAYLLRQLTYNRGHPEAFSGAMTSS